MKLSELVEVDSLIPKISCKKFDKHLIEGEDNETIDSTSGKDMDDSTNLPVIGQNLSSSLTCICANEISLRGHLYIISMCITHSEQPLIDIKVEAKENADQWKSSFDATAIETMTTKTGNFKSFNVFINMLENAINQQSSSVSIDLFTSDDLELIRKTPPNQVKVSSGKLSRKRYLILIYNAEYDRVYYPLSLRYCGKPDPVVLIEQIRQLATENQLLKSRFESDTEHSDFQTECSRLKKENEEYRQQLLLYNSKEKDQQIDFLRRMIRASEDALNKERNNSTKTKAKKDDRYKSLLHQIESLKVSERQLKLKVKNLTNENSQRSSSLSRPVSSNQRQYRSGSVMKRLPSSIDSHLRFNPTAYIHERNLKLRQIELQKKKETRRRLSSGRCCSDSDNSDTSAKSIDHNQPKKNRSRKRTNNLHRRQSKDSIDSDIERVSSPPVLHRAASNNSTNLFSPDDEQQNPNSANIGHMIDIDQRLKILEKFIKQNYPH